MKTIIYKNHQGHEPFSNWINKKLDSQIKFRIHDRIERIEEYNILGDWKQIDEEICELRFHFGAGYRVYFYRQNSQTIVILCGGNKASQSADIIKAKQYLEDYKNDTNQ